MNPPLSKPDAATTAPPPAARTDVHFHVFEARVGVAGARYVPAYAATLAQWEAAAGAAGVTHGVLVQPSFLGTDNRLLLRTLAQRPATLRGIAVVSPTTPHATLAAMDAAGVRGIRLNLAGAAEALDAWAAAGTLWDALGELGWHLELHTDTGALPGVLARLPAHLPLVVDHLARPASAATGDPTFATLERRAAQARVHVTLSGAYRQGGRDAAVLARRWLATLGPQALLWGSDWPCTNHEAQADYARLAAEPVAWVGEAAAGQARGPNAQQVYWRR